MCHSLLLSLCLFLHLFLPLPPTQFLSPLPTPFSLLSVDVIVCALPIACVCLCIHGCFLCVGMVTYVLCQPVCGLLPKKTCTDLFLIGQIPKINAAVLPMQHTTAAKGFSAVCCMHILWWMLNYHFSHILIEQLSVNGFAAESHDFRSAAYRFCNTCKALWEGTHTNTLLPAKHLHRSSILWHALITVFPFYIWLFFFFLNHLSHNALLKRESLKWMCILWVISPQDVGYGNIA